MRVVGWFINSLKTLCRPEVRPRQGQWWGALAIGAFAFVLYAGIAFAMNSGRSFAIPSAAIIAVLATGLAVCVFVKWNLQSALAREYGAATLAFLMVYVIVAVHYTCVFGAFGTFSGLLNNPMLVVMPLAMILSQVALVHPPSYRPICASCEYPYIEVDPPNNCPECGSLWTRHGGTKLPKPKLNKRFAAAAGTLLFVPFVFQLLDQKNLIPLPTSYLVWRAKSEQFDFRGTYKRLVARQLDPATTRSLAEHLLSKSLTDISTSSDGMAWLEGLVVNAKLPPDLVERYFAEMRTPVVKVSANPAAGQQAAVLLGFTGRQFLVSSLESFALVRSLEVLSPAGERVAFMSNNPSARPLGSFEAIWSAPHTPPPKAFAASSGALLASYPNLIFTPAAPGRYSIRAEVWMVVRPKTAVPWLPPYFDAEGTLIPPPDALWSKRLDFREEFEVMPSTGQSSPPPEPQASPQPSR